ncbi:MAG TPA: hypothetical protein VE967_04215, partial [Gemmatimonadaceae bacterium]|nr:hypothetical protein [Gemmatimonadaceae bacterium]
MNMRYCRVAALAWVFAPSIGAQGVARPGGPGAVPRLDVALEWRIDAHAHRLGQATQVGIGPDGRVVVASNLGGGDMVAFDSTGTTELWRI